MQWRLLVGACWCLLIAATAWAKPSVTLEMVTEQGVPPTAQQKWLATLKDCGFDHLRIRTGELGDRVGLEVRGQGDSATYHVVGILSANGTLYLPSGGRFTSGDRAAIAAWVEKLRGGGAEGLTDKPAAFGFTARELVALHDRLAAPITFSTRGQNARAMLEKLVRAMPVPVTASAQARAALMTDELVGDELLGVSSGTGLAALARPLGLVIVPRKGANGAELALVDVREAMESWPVGWPSEKPDRDVAPKLFEFLNAEFNDVPLLEALGALEKRLEMPALFDHNSLARQRIDLAAIKVSLPEGKTFYKRILDRILTQAKLTMEVRVDEAGKPFLWISTLRKS